MAVSPFRAFVGIALVVLLAGGCGRSGTDAEPAPAPPAPAGPAGDATDETPPAAPAPSPDPPARSATPVAFESLMALLPDLPGWTRSDASGEQFTAPGRYSRAQARYARDGSRIELEITDTAFSQSLLAPLSVFLASGYSERSDDGFRRATRVGGYPAFETWNAGTRHGELTLVVNDRFVVTGVGRDVSGPEAVHAVIGAVDLSSLAALR